jgi:hypothetical protein
MITLFSNFVVGNQASNFQTTSNFLFDGLISNVSTEILDLIEEFSFTTDNPDYSVLFKRRLNNLLNERFRPMFNCNFIVK